MTSLSSMLLRASLGGALLLAASTTARAANTMLARCGSDGATFHLTDVSEADASVVYNLPAAPKQDAVLVIDGDSGSAHWSTASRRAIDRKCGGDGNDEIVLFESMQPRDGLWHTHMTDHRTTGCPPLFAAQAEALLPVAATKDANKQRTFNKPFHPSGLMDEGDQMQWVQVGADRWRGVLRMKGGANQGGMSMSVVLQVNVISPTRMDGTNTVTLHMPPQMVAKMGGGGSGGCQSVVHAQMTWSK